MSRSGGEISLSIDGVASGGEGVGRGGQGAVFVPGALPGERVTARLTRQKKNYARAELTRVLEASPDRVEPPCPYFGRCGGCSLQHAAYPAQLELKRRMVEQTLRRIGGAEVAVPLTLGAERPFHYRCRAVLHAELQNEGADFGFYQPDSHLLTPADSCLLLTAPLLDLIALLRQGLPDYAPALPGLRELSLRCSADGQRLLLSFVADRPLEILPRLVAELAASEPRLASVWENSGGPVYGVYGPDWRHLSGAAYLSDELAGVKLEVAPAAFTQVNPEQTARLYGVAAAYAGQEAGGDLLDLYCGLGGVGLALAGPETRLIGVESYGPAVEAARRNAGLNGREQAVFFAGRAEEVLPGLQEQGIRPGTAVLDPPRSGCAEQALAALVTLMPRRIVYISCAPATLARDLKYLAAGGYRLEQVQPVDMFCQTAHVECVIMMTNSGSKGKLGGSTTICSGFGAKNEQKLRQKTAIFDPVFWGVS